MTTTSARRPADSFDRTCRTLLVLGVGLFCAGIIALVLYLRGHGVML